MEKISINIAPEKEISFDFQKIEIIVKPYFTAQDKLTIYQTYHNNMFFRQGNAVNLEIDSDLPTRYCSAEHAVILSILDLCTNIDIEHESFDLDMVINSGLWSVIKRKINDFDLFEIELEKFRDYCEKQLAIEKSVGVIIDSLSNQLSRVIRKMPELNMGSIENLLNGLGDKLNELDKKVPGIVKEGIATKTKRIKKA